MSYKGEEMAFCTDSDRNGLQFGTRGDGHKKISNLTCLMITVGLPKIVGSALDYGQIMIEDKPGNPFSHKGNTHGKATAH